MEISTLSGNWSAKWTAAEHPYGYLLAGKEDDNIEGYAQTMYEVGMLLTTDQGFVNDIQKALKKYSARLEKKANVEEDEVEESASLDFERKVQEVVEMDKRERRKYRRDADRWFKKAVKEIGDEAKG